MGDIIGMTKPELVCRMQSLAAAMEHTTQYLLAAGAARILELEAQNEALRRQLANDRPVIAVVVEHAGQRPFMLTPENSHLNVWKKNGYVLTRVPTGL